MLIYPSFIYLQNHKTGCTFVETCLREFCAEPLQAHHKHAALDAAPGRFCFTNVREPLALYRSLFAYGLDGKGTVYLRLKRLGHGHLYEQGAQGFLNWLDFVIRHQHASLLSDAYTPKVAKLVGFMSWRFLRLACPGFEKAAPTLPDAKGLAAYAQTRNVLGAVLHQENLRDELKALLTGKLAAHFSDQSALCRWLDETPKINASQNAVDEVAVEGGLLVRVLLKEAILYRNFYPGALQALRPQADRGDCQEASR
jgi:hypothetical protein